MLTGRPGMSLFPCFFRVPYVLSSPVPAGDIWLYRLATSHRRRSWNTDAMTRRPIPAPGQQAQDSPRTRPSAPQHGLRPEAGEEDAVTPDDRQAVRQARAGGARRSRSAGLPGRIEDPAAAALVAGLLREPGDRGVVLSGRCGTCGYLLGSSGHQVSCGT